MRCSSSNSVLNPWRGGGRGGGGRGGGGGEREGGEEREGGRGREREERGGVQGQRGGGRQLVPSTESLNLKTAQTPLS